MKIKEMEYGMKHKRELLCGGNYKGFNFYILSLGTHPTAYIEIPKNHKLYGKSYGEICDNYDIKVHGGLTYSDDFLRGIKSESWFIGWDYAHAGDYIGLYEGSNFSTEDKKWSVDEMIEDCKNGIDSILEGENEI